jgi:crotonobetainyl-CoA:carnitine CoA-transferase CaiB-like acyl-CoA transferase
MPEMGTPPRPVGADTETVLADFGYSEAEIGRLKNEGVVGTS